MAVGSLATLFRGMSFDELAEVRRLLEEAESTREEEVKEVEKTYGEFFCSVVGAKRIFSLVAVPAAQLDLVNNVTKYNEKRVLPSMLGNHSAVRSVLEDGRSLIALKIEILNRETKEVVATVVELVFKRYAKLDECYVTALYNRTEDGQCYPSCLYSTGGMNCAQMEAVKNLLDGETIVAPIENYLIRKA